jgi:heme-degrading monooxygenase HmoA
MHAVVARSTIHDFEQARKFLREEGIPRLSQAPGFISGHWVRLGETEGASMIVFESEEAAQAAAEMFRTNPPPTVTPVSIEVGEVQEHA